MNIKFNDNDIDLDALNEDIASLYESYLSSKKWAQNQEAKNKWLEAYNNINSRGITGVRINNGRYVLSHNGEAFEDPDGYYGDAANFIINRAKTLLSKESVKKKDLEDYSSFKDRLTTYLVNNNYGGNAELFGKTWTNLDKADLWGQRGTSERKKALRQALIDYKTTLEDDKYSFENTSYRDINDLRTKIDKAITSLDDPNNTDYSALHSLGIDESLWFSTNEAEAKAKREEFEKAEKAKRDELIQKLQAEKANQYKTLQFINIDRLNGTPPSGENALDKLNSYYNIANLNGQQRSELAGVFKYAQRHNILYNLTKDELKKFGRFSDIVSNPTRLKRIPGLTGFYYDTYANKIIRPFMGDRPETSLQEVINLNSPEALKNLQELENQRLRDKDALRKEINANDILYLSSIVPDVISLFDEEPVTAGILGTTAAGIRHAALANRPGGMSTEDKLWQILDYAGGAFSSVPFFGDAYALGRIINTARKAGTTLLAIAGIVGVSKDLYNTISKLANGEDLTAKEKVAIASSLPLIIQSYRSGRAWKQNETIKAANEGEKTLQGVITATNGSIKGVKKETAQQLQKEFKKAGNDNTKKLEILLRNDEVKQLAKELNVKIEDLLFESHILNGKYSPVKKQQDIKIEDVPTGNSVYRQNYLNYLRELESGNFWLRNKARGLKETDWFYNATGGPRNNTNKNGWFSGIFKNKDLDRVKANNDKDLDRVKANNDKDESLLVSYATGDESPYAKKPLENNPTAEKPAAEKPVDHFISYNRETMLRYNDVLNSRFGKEELKSENIKIGDKTLLVVKQTDGSYNIMYKGEIIGNERNQIEILKVVQNIIRNLNKKDSTFGKVSAAEMGRILREFKAVGWIKKGGIIDKLKVLMYKTYIKK